MIRITKIINRTLSFRLSLRVIAALATLLMMALLVMLMFSRKAMKEEALLNAEQTLESLAQKIDNVLLSVEQASGNIYWRIYSDIHHPEKTKVFMQKLVEANPYITDCNIVWDSDSNAIKTNITGWIDPQDAGSDNRDPVGIFSLPIYENQQKVGAMAVEVSLAQLSKFLLETKPTPNAFCTLLRKDGTVVVHPDSSVLNKNILILAKDDDASMREAAQAMINGETGYKYVELDGEDYYVFYKPFERTAIQGRAMTELGWSAGIILPEDDILGTYYRLHYIVVIIAIAGLLLLLFSCQFYIRRQLLPLRKLEKSAQHIAEGNYDEIIPNSRRQDEVGRLQSHFKDMQQSLSTRFSELQHLSATLEERGKVLQATYEQTQAADRMKINFLHNMSDQMKPPVSDIYNSAMTISKHCNELTEEETNSLVDKIQLQGGKVTSLLNQVISESEKLTN